MIEKLIAESKKKPKKNGNMLYGKKRKKQNIEDDNITISSLLCPYNQKARRSTQSCTIGGRNVDR